MDWFRQEKVINIFLVYQPRYPVLSIDIITLNLHNVKIYLIQKFK